MIKYSFIHVKVLPILMVIAGIWIAFGSSLSHDFVWDDHILIVNNAQIKELSSIYDFFSRSFWHIDENDQDKTRSFYRPLIMASYAIDYHVHGINPKGFHFTNILAHLLCAILVYLLAARLLENSTQAIIAALIWAIHPTHVENVVWISGRTDIFAGVFYLLSFYLFLMWLTGVKRTWFFLVGACVSYALALHCKEMAITLPFLFCIGYFLIKERNCSPASAKLGLAVIIVISLEYLLVRHLVLSNITISTLSHAWGDILLSLPLVFTQYIGLVLGLVPIDPHHSEIPLKNPWSFSFAFYIMIVMGYAALLTTLLHRRQRTLLFCFLWFPVTLMPVFALGGFGDILYADRFLYIPSVGLILGAVTVICRFVKRKGKMIRGAAILTCAAYLFVNISYSRTSSAYWKDDLRLFSQAAMTSPESAYIQFNLGNILSYAESYEKSLEAYNRAISLFPRYVEAYNNKAFVLNRLERFEEALACSKKVISLRGVIFATFTNMGDSLMGMADFGGAEKLYAGSLAMKETAIGHNQLGLCLMQQGKMDEAYAHFMKALSIKMNPRILNNVGRLFLKQGNPDKAIEYSKRALSRLKANIPSNIKLEIHYTMACALMQKGADAEAQHHVRQTEDLLALGYGTPSIRASITEWVERNDKAVLHR